MLVSRILSAWPPFSLIGAYEMLLRQIRQSVANRGAILTVNSDVTTDLRVDMPRPVAPAAPVVRRPSVAASGKWHGAERIQRHAWQWALSQRLSAGDLPTGEAIAEAFQRSARWGRVVKNAGLAGRYDRETEQQAA